MKYYTVNFYYYSDLRFSTDVSAINEIIALGIALNSYKDIWITEKGYRVEILNIKECLKTVLEKLLKQPLTDSLLDAHIENYEQHI